VYNIADHNTHDYNDISKWQKKVKKNAREKAKADRHYEQEKKIVISSMIGVGNVKLK